MLRSRFVIVSIALFGTAALALPAFGARHAQDDSAHSGMYVGDTLQPRAGLFKRPRPIDETDPWNGGSAIAKLEPKSAATSGVETDDPWGPMQGAEERHAIIAAVAPQNRKPKRIDVDDPWGFVARPTPRPTSRRSLVAPDPSAVESSSERLSEEPTKPAAAPVQAPSDENKRTLNRAEVADEALQTAVKAAIDAGNLTRAMQLLEILRSGKRPARTP